MTRNVPSLRGVIATIGLAALGALAPARVGAQGLPAGHDGERFDVASIKAGARPRVPIPQVRGDVVQIGGVTLGDLIRFAYPTAERSGLHRQSARLGDDGAVRRIGEDIRRATLVGDASRVTGGALQAAHARRIPGRYSLRADDGEERRKTRARVDESELPG